MRGAGNGAAQRGQSVVEYMLLTSVVLLMVLAAMNAVRASGFLGQDSDFFALMRGRFIYTYQHARDGVDEDAPNLVDYNNPASHPSYYSAQGGRTRFFTGTEEYPLR